MTVDFTEQERIALIQLIDLAVKAGGLNVADAALVLAKKLKPEAEPAKAVEGELVD